MKTYEILFDILSQESDYVSGEKLAQKLGISRTSIWKAIQRLEKEGIRIETWMGAASSIFLVISKSPEMSL